MGRMKIKEKFIETKFGRVCYLECGTGKNILYSIHGFGYNPQDIKYFAPIFEASNLRIMSPYLPGHGKSFDVPRGFTFDLAADTLLEFITRTSGGNINLFGHSLGGGLACEIIRKSQKVRKAILVGPQLEPINGLRILTSGLGLSFDLFIDGIRQHVQQKEWRSVAAPKIKKNSLVQNLFGPLNMVMTAKRIEFPLNDSTKLLFLLGSDDHALGFDVTKLRRYGQVKIYSGSHCFSYCQPNGFWEEVAKFLNV